MQDTVAVINMGMAIVMDTVMLMTMGIHITTLKATIAKTGNFISICINMAIAVATIIPNIKSLNPKIIRSPLQ